MSSSFPTISGPTKYTIDQGVNFKITDDAVGSFNNYNGTMLIYGGSFTNTDKSSNSGTLRIKPGKFTNSPTGSIDVTQSARLINDDQGVFVNEGTIVSYGQLVNKSSSVQFTNNGKIISHGLIDNAKTFVNTGSIESYGRIYNEYGHFINSGHLIVNGTFDDRGRVTNTGLFGGSGQYYVSANNTPSLDNGSNPFENLGTISPGSSSGGLTFVGDLLHSGLKFIEIGGHLDSGRSQFDTEFDFVDVAGDLIIDGGILDVSLIDDFKLERGQEFIISQVEGEVIGFYEGLEEGALVGQFESVYGSEIGLNISYKAGDGNDISLYTEALTNSDMIFGSN